MRFEQVQISAAGLVSPYGLGVQVFQQCSNDRISPRLPAALKPPASALLAPDQALVPDYDITPFLGRTGVRNLDRLTRLLGTATVLLHEALGFQDKDQRRNIYADDQTSLVVGTSGGLQSILDFDLDTIRQPGFVQPGQFPNTVFSAAASYAAIRHSIRASCITITNGATSSLDALAMGAVQLECGRTSLALAGGAEEFSAARVLASAVEHRGNLPEYGEGAAMFALERAEDLAARGGEALASLLMVHSGLLLKLNDLPAQVEAWLTAEDVEMDSAVHLYCRKEHAASLRTVLPYARTWELGTTLGDMGAAHGAFALAHGLYNRDIRTGEKLLLIDLDEGGNLSLLLARKQVA